MSENNNEANINSETTSSEGASDTTNSSGSQTNPTFTQEDVDKILSDRLNRERKKFTEEMAKKDEQTRQASELAKLEGIEKLKKEAELERTRLSEERDTYRNELKLANARVALSAAGLSADFAETVIGEDDEQTAKRISELSKQVEAQVASKIKDSLAKGAPPKPSGGDEVSPSRELIRKNMGLK